MVKALLKSMGNLVRVATSVAEAHGGVRTGSLSRW